MRKETQGVVIEIMDNMAKVKVNRHGECKNCGACPGDNALVLEAKNPIQAKLGERVVFEIKETNMLKAAFIVYILPLIAIFLGCIAGNWLALKVDEPVKIFQIGGGVVAFILSVFYIKFFEKSAHNNEKMQPIIIRVL